MIQEIDKNFSLHAAHLPSFCNIMQVLEEEGLSYIDSGLKADTFNVIHIDDPKKLTKEGLDKALKFYDNRLRESCIWIAENNLTDEVKSIFNTLEVLEAGVNKGFTAKIDQLTSGAYDEITLVKNRQDIIDNAFVIANNWDPFDVNVLHYYNNVHQTILERKDTILLNYHEDGVVVGVIELFVDFSSKTAGIYNLSVMIENRNQGIGQKLIEQAITFAKMLEVETVVTQASEDSENLFRKVGFTEDGKIYEFTKK